MVNAPTVLTAIALAASVLVFGSSADAGKRDNSVRFADEQVLDNADPYYNNVRIGVILSQQVWDTLIYRDPVTGTYSGLLATSWRRVDDKTLELDLRRGVKFHNGAEFDADDVVYTLNYVSHDNKVIQAQQVTWIDRVEKIDKYKVRIYAREPAPVAIDFLSSITVIHPHDYYAKAGSRGMSERPVGTGPYRVVEHALGKFVRLARNPDYFTGGPKRPATIPTIEIRFIPDRQTQVAEMLSGGLDLIRNVAPDQAAQLRSVPDLQVKSTEIMRYTFLAMDTTDNTLAPQLRDIRVRRAIMHAIDRQAIVTQLVGAGSRVIHASCYPTQFGCSDEGIRRYSYDPARARQLLADAGLPNGFALDIYAYRDRDQVEAMIGYLRAVGIRANLRFMQYAAVRDAVRAGKAPLVHWSWGSNSIGDVSASVSVFHKFLADDINRDPEVRDLLALGDSTMDPAARKTAYAKALALIAERAYVLPLNTTPTTYVATKDLEFEAYPDEMPRFWEMTWK